MTEHYLDDAYWDVEPDDESTGLSYFIPLLVIIGSLLFFGYELNHWIERSTEPPVLVLRITPPIG